MLSKKGFSQISVFLYSDACTFKFIISSINVSTIQSDTSYLKGIEGFPGGAVVESTPADAGATSSSPGQGGSHMPQSSWPRVPQLLSLLSGAREPQLLRPACLEPVLRNGRSHRDGRPAHRGGEWLPLAAARGGPRAATRTQRSQK